jgi:hypothetical protein
MVLACNSEQVLPPLTSLAPLSCPATLRASKGSLVSHPPFLTSPPPITNVSTEWYSLVIRSRYSRLLSLCLLTRPLCHQPLRSTSHTILPLPSSPHQIPSFNSRALACNLHPLAHRALPPSPLNVPHPPHPHPAPCPTSGPPSRQRAHLLTHSYPHKHTWGPFTYTRPHKRSLPPSCPVPFLRSSFPSTSPPPAAGASHRSRPT